MLFFSILQINVDLTDFRFNYIAPTHYLFDIVICNPRGNMDTSIEVRHIILDDILGMMLNLQLFSLRQYMILSSMWI
jgi:hypothetical protein